MRRVLVEYTVREDADLAEVESQIGEFVSGIRGLGVGIDYTSHRRKDAPRSYAHLGIIPTEEAAAALQAAPFFGRFTSYLKEKCVSPPKATALDVVASTEPAR